MAFDPTDPTGEFPNQWPSQDASSASPTPSPTPAPLPASYSGYADSAAVVPGAPSPLPALAAAVPSPLPSSSPAPVQYNQHGYYQPTDDQVGQFKQAVAAGMPLDQIDERYRASMYVRLGGDPAQNFDMYKTLVWDPAKDSANKNLSAGVQEVESNPLGFAVSKAGDAWNWLAAQTGSIVSGLGDIIKPNSLDELANIPLKEDDTGFGNPIRGVAAGTSRFVSETEQTGAGLWNALGSVLEFKPGQAGVLLNAASTHARNASVLVTDGAAKGVNDVANMITTAATMAPNFASWGLQHIPGIPQNVKDAADTRDAQINFNILNFQRGMDLWTDGFSGKIADTLASIGSATNPASGIPQAVGPMLQFNAAQTKASEATITPAQLLGSRTVGNFLNYVGPEMAMKGEGSLIKPSYLSAIKDSGDVLKGLKADEGSILSKIGAAQDLKTSAQQGALFESGQILADLREQQAAAATNLSRAQEARTAALPPDGGPPHPMFDQNISDAQSHLDSVSQQLGQAVQAHPTSPDQIPTSLFDQNINDLQGNLADVRQKIAAATEDHRVQIQNAGNQLQRNVGLANQMVGQAFQGAGGVMKGMAVASKWAGDRFNALTNTIAGGNPQAAQALRWALQGVAGDIAGRVIGQETLGAVTGEVLPFIGHSFAPIGETLGVIGREFLVGEATSPFAARVAQNLQGLPQWAAKAFDNSFFNDVSKTTSAAVNTGIHAGLINAGISFAGSGGNLGAAGQGLISGGILGMGGGAFKTWRDFKSPDQVASAQVGDRYRFMQSLDSDTKAQFKKYTPETQLSLGSYFSQHPDLRLRFDAPEGSGGHYEVNSTNQTATIHVDPTAPDGALPLIISHEFNHHIQDHGLQDELNSRLLGNKDTGEPGFFARLHDATGKPVRLSDGSFAPNDDLVRMQGELAAKYHAAGFPDEAARLTPERTLRELAAESAIGLVSPGSMEPRPTLIGKLLDAGTAPFVTKPFVKNALAVLGNGFDINNNIVGTGLFTGEKRIPILDHILTDWYGNRRKLSPLDSGDSTSILPRDLANKTDAEIRNITGAVDTWKTDGRGRILRGPDGSPLVNTRKQMDAKANEIGSVIHQTITNIGPDARLANGIREDGSGGWILPSKLGGGLEKLFGNKLNPEQLANLKKFTDLSSIDPGAALNMRYQGAYTRGKFTQPVPGSIPIKEHTVMPMRVQVTKAGNLIGHAFAHDQLLENAEVASRKGLGVQHGYNSVGQVYDAARNMIETIAKGHPAESVVSPAQKRFLYELTGLDPKVDGQNVFSDISKAHRSESVWKTFRIDRINRASIDPSSKWAIHSGIYDPLIAYRTTGKLALGGNYGTNVNPAAFGHRAEYSRGAAAIASQQAPYAQRAALAGPALDYIHQVAAPPVRQPAPVPRAQLVAPRAQLVSPQAAISAGPSTPPERPVDAATHNAQLAQRKPGTSRLAMARNIISLETDTKNGLKIEQLPPGDGGGPGYEVAGITQRFDGPMASRLAYLVRSGKQDQAYKEAQHYIANQTDGIYKYVPQASLTNHPGVEQYLRDTYFHQGSGAVQRILSRTLGFAPRYLTPELAAQGIRQPGFLERLRQNRQLYMQIVQNPAANLRQGVANRIDHAASIASSM